MVLRNRTGVGMLECMFVLVHVYTCEHASLWKLMRVYVDTYAHLHMYLCVCVLMSSCIRDERKRKHARRPCVRIHA